MSLVDALPVHPLVSLMNSLRAFLLNVFDYGRGFNHAPMGCGRCGDGLCDRFRFGHRGPGAHQKGKGAKEDDCCDSGLHCSTPCFGRLFPPSKESNDQSLNRI